MCLDYDEEIDILTAMESGDDKDIMDALENEAILAEQERVYESGIKRGCGA
jgi:hypothetical protein